MAKPTANFAGSFDCAQDDRRVLTTLRQQPSERVIQIGERSSFDRIVVMRAAQFDDAFFSAVRVDYETVKTRRHDLVFFSQ